jgi:hypothetical protein
VQPVDGTTGKLKQSEHAGQTDACAGGPTQAGHVPPDISACGLPGATRGGLAGAGAPTKSGNHFLAGSPRVPWS